MTGESFLDTTAAVPRMTSQVACASSGRWLWLPNMGVVDARAA